MKALAKIFSISVLSFGLANATPYIVDDSHTNVGFSVKHLMITNVKGEFKDYDAQIDFDSNKKVFNSFKAQVETTSINTGIEDRDNHLRSDDFFSSKKFPEMTFVMKSYEKDGDDGKMTGDLTIRDVTKTVIFNVEDLGTIKDFKNKNRVGFTLKGKINRLDYGLKWNKALEFGGVAVSEDVKISIDVEAIESVEKK